MISDFALVFGQAAALFVCGYAIYLGVVSVGTDNWVAAVLEAPLMFFLSLANFVVFSKVSRL